MQYRVTTQDGHSVTLAPSSDGQTFEVCDLTIDLSQAALITDPSKEADECPQRSESLHPLGPRAQYAFEGLSELEPERVSRSPLLKALIAFKDRRLPQLLEEISTPHPAPAIDPTVFEKLSREPGRAETLLSRIVREIDSELPGYFGTERDTGVFRWLESGGSLSTEYAVGEERPLIPSEAQNTRHLVTDISGSRVLFDLKSQTSHVNTVSTPSTQTVLYSLCIAGTLGQEIVELNRSALLNTATMQLRHQIELRDAKDPAAAVQNYLENEASVGLHTRLVQSMLGACFMTCTSALILLHLARGSASAYDIMAGALATYIGQRTVRLFGEYRAMKRAISEAAAEIAEELHDGDSAGGIAILRLFSTSIIDHVVSMSAGRQYTRFGERTQADWSLSLPRLVIPDTNIFRPRRVAVAPNVEVVRPEPMSMNYSEIEDFSDLSCDAREVGALALPELLRATHIERGATACNTLNALSIVRDFTETQGIHTPEQLWFDYVRALADDSSGRVDDKGTYPEIASAFSRVTCYFHINRTTWDQISLALQAASTLERVSQTRKAQAIAAEAVRQEFLS